MRLDLSKLHTNQRLLVEELIKRGAAVAPLDYDLELLEVSYNGKTEYLMDRASKVTAYLPSSLTADKHLTKQILEKNGIAVPAGRIFDGAQVAEALNYGDEIGFPLVVKPNVGSHGDLVRSGIENREQLESAIYAFLNQADEKEYFIVERHVGGHEYRIFITAKGDYAVLLREPAYVTGDGVNSIKMLAEQETSRRQRIKEKDGSALCPVALDQIALNFLRRKEIDFDYVPDRDEKVYLRLSSNLAQGGVSKDMTDEAHPSAIGIARKVLAAFDGLPCLGIDFLTPDIAVDQTVVPHAIIEVNANPGLSMHHMPAIGRPRNVAGYLADVTFPFL